MSPIFRVGFGYDVHRLVEGRDLWLSGIRIKHSMGLLGHSDADVLIHTTCGALLGTANMRDIGYHFPNTSDKTLNMDSKVISQETMALITTKGYQLGNVDAIVCTEQPEINPHISATKSCLARLMQTGEDSTPIKTTTSERVGFVGHQEGVAVYTAVLIAKI